MEQTIVIIDDATEHVELMAQALREHGYGVTTLQIQSSTQLHASLRLMQPDFLVISDDIIDLKAANSLDKLQELGIAC